MLNTMTPPQGPYQQPNNPAGNPILLAQQKRDSSSSSMPTPPSENSSSPVSSSASTTSSSSASTGSSASLPSNLLSTTTTNQKAITSQQMSATSERLRGSDDKAQARGKDSPAAKTGGNQPRQDIGQQSADQAERLGPPVSPASKRSSAQPDFHQNNATTTSQDNSSKGQAESQPTRISDYATASSQAPPIALSTHQHQSADPPAGSNSQFHHQQSHQQHQNHNQHNTSNHYKPTGHHSQPYRNSRFNNHMSQQQQQQQQQHHHQHQNSNHNTQNSHNSIKSSTSNTNSGSFSSIRSRNQRGHNNSHRHNKNNHHQNHHQNHNQHHNHQNHQNQQQQSALMTNGNNLNTREVQHNLPAPYSAAAASASPTTSLSGSEIGARNSSSSMSRHLAAPTPAGPPHYVEMHVFAGECVAFQLMDGQEQIITGPATMTMVSQQESPPVPIPVQVPPGHTIHQVADENGTLRHIIFSVMNCEDGDHMNSNVIDFPHETFRVDSLGELVSTSSNAIGLDGNASNCDQQASSPSSKSTSVSYEKIDPSHHYNMPHHQDTLNMGSTPIDDSRGSSHYKNMKSSYKHGSSRHLSNHPGRYKGTGNDRDRQQLIDNGRRLVREQANYDMSGHNLSASGMMPVSGAEVGPEMDPSLMVNFGQMMPPGVEDQMYSYPNCVCCCCYCDPNAEAAAAAAAAAVAANNQPLNSPAQISTGSLIGQQDVIMMQQMEPQPPVPSMQHETRMVGSGSNSFRNGRGGASGNSMVYQSQHQANTMTNPSPHQQPQQVFSNQPNLPPTQTTKSVTNVNGTKSHTNKGPRGAHQAKQQHGNKSHQSNYDRHHGNQNHHENQLSYNNVASSGSSQAQQVAVKETMSQKSSLTKQPTTHHSNQQLANQANRLASEEKTSVDIAAPTISKSPSAKSSPARPAAVDSTTQKSNQKLRDSTPTPQVKGENQILEVALTTSETTSSDKEQNYQTREKSTVARSIVVSPDPAAIESEMSMKEAPGSTSSSNSASSPNRQPSQTRQSPSTTRSSHHKNQESTLVSRKSHQSDDATKAYTAPDHQARPQPNSTTQRFASATVANKSDASRDDTPSVSSSVTRVTKQSAKVSPIDSANHQHHHQQSKQKQIDNGKRGEETVVASQQEPSRRIKQKKHHHNYNHNQSIKVMSILKQCRNKLTTNTEKVVQNLLSSYSDTKFAGLLLVIFTMFATFLAILIDHYIVAPVTE